MADGKSGDDKKGDSSLTPKDLQARYNGKVTVETLAKWRKPDGGPPFKKLGGLVTYSLSAMKAWEEANTDKRD